MKPFTLSGSVKRFSGIGRKLGYPTANIKVASDVPEGVFAGYTYVGNKKLPSMIFVGAPTTLGDNKKRAESHILGFPNEDLYGRPIRMEVVKKLRDNHKFESLEALVVQIREDNRW